MWSIHWIKASEKPVELNETEALIQCSNIQYFIKSVALHLETEPKSIHDIVFLSRKSGKIPEMKQPAYQ